MQVSKSSYYHWLKHKDLKTGKKSVLHLKKRIVDIFNSSNKVYGSRRIQKSLEREGLVYSVSYISLLMKKIGVKSVLGKKFKVMTTDSDHRYPVADNLLNRDFTTNRLGEKWVSDITYIRVGKQWNYLTTVMDLADRKILAWTLSEDMTMKNTTYCTWIKAKNKRQTTENHIFHSDRGVQYAAHKMKLIFSTNTTDKQSMSRKGNCWDNAVAESLFKTIKYECTNRYVFKNYKQAYTKIDNYIQWYNTQRLHSALGYRTPLEVEIQYWNNNRNVA